MLTGHECELKIPRSPGASAEEDVKIKVVMYGAADISGVVRPLPRSGMELECIQRVCRCSSIGAMLIGSTGQPMTTGRSQGG